MGTHFTRARYKVWQAECGMLSARRLPRHFMHSHSLASHVRLVTLNRVLRNMKEIFMIEDDDDEIAFIKEEARHQLNDRYFK